MMVTHFVHKLGLLDKVQPMEAFYPVPFPERTRMIRKAEKVEARFTPATTAVHLWASNKRELGCGSTGCRARAAISRRSSRSTGLRR